MKKILLAAVCVLLISSYAMAQDYPQAEFFGGYFLQRADLPDGILPSDSDVSAIRDILEYEGFSTRYNSEDFLTKGFQVSATFNLNEYFGAEGAFRYNRGQVYELNMATDYKGEEFDWTQSADFVQYAVMGGPHVAFREMGAITPFAHALVGVDYVDQGRIFEFQAGEDLIQDFLEYFESVDMYPSEEGDQFFDFRMRDYIGTDVGFAFTVGGGVDLNVNDYWAIRLVQADYFVAMHEDLNYNNFGISFGAVFLLGGL